MATSVTWYITHVTRDDGSDTSWDVQGASTRLDVWFGTQAEWNALTPAQRAPYEVYIIDSTSTSGQSVPDMVNANELRAGLVRYDLNTPGLSFNIANNSGYLGTFNVDYTDDGVTNPRPTVAFAVDGTSIESSTDAYIITTRPVTASPLTAHYQGGVGHFNPFHPGSLAPPCFVAGTLIATPGGLRPVETLRAGDLVLTQDRGPVPLRLALSAEICAERLALEPELRPIRITRGALGNEMPCQDLLVSPQHRVLVRSKIAQRMFSAAEVLVAAKQLTQLDGIEVASDMTSCVYYHLVFDRHEVVFSNGAATESLYPGPMALQSLGQAAREEIYALFPELRPSAAGHAEIIEARTLIAGRRGRRLASRHQHSHMPLVS